MIFWYWDGLLVVIAGATFVVLCYIVKSLKLVWRFDTCKWNLWVPDRQISYRDLTWIWGTRTVVPVIGLIPDKQHCGLRMRWGPGTFFLAPQVSDLDMHHGTCLTHVPWCTLGSLTSGFLWNQWRGELSRHSRRMCNSQFYVSGKRPVAARVTRPTLRAWTRYNPNVVDLCCACW